MTRSGTNCCFKLLHAGKLHMSELCELLKTMYPQFAAGIPTGVAPGASLDLDSWGFDNSKMVRTVRYACALRMPTALLLCGFEQQ
jgi:hypothetical protein|eukprot:COSAG06_NODE_329_length_17412_cov_9.404015_14_plen_85_part_00